MRRETAVARSLDFVEIQNNEATTAVASIEDAAECGERADALVSGLLAGVMRQRRTVATAMDYVRGAVAGDQGERVGAGEEGRARGAAPDPVPAQQAEMAVGTGPGGAAAARAAGAAR